MRIYQVTSNERRQQVRELFWEYLQWANRHVHDSIGVSFEIEAWLENDMQTLARFHRPDGRLLLGEVDGKIAGHAAGRTSSETALT